VVAHAYAHVNGGGVAHEGDVVAAHEVDEAHSCCDGSVEVEEGGSVARAREEYGERVDEQRVDREALAGAREVLEGAHGAREGRARGE
jgi:hypothetical protein